MLRELRLAIRTLWRTPGFTLIPVAALALGIGANSAQFSTIYSVILRPLAVAEPERLVMVWKTRPDRTFTNNVVSNASSSLESPTLGSSAWKRLGARAETAT